MAERGIGRKPPFSSRAHALGENHFGSSAAIASAKPGRTPIFSHVFRIRWAGTTFPHFFFVNWTKTTFSHFLRVTWAQTISGRAWNWAKTAFPHWAKTIFSRARPLLLRKLDKNYFFSRLPRSLRKNHLWSSAAAASAKIGQKTAFPHCFCENWAKTISGRLRRNVVIDSAKIGRKPFLLIAPTKSGQKPFLLGRGRTRSLLLRKLRENHCLSRPL